MTVVPAVLVALISAALLALGVRALAVFGDLSAALTGIWETLAQGLDASEGSVRQEIRDLEDLVDRLPQRWEEIQRESARLDARARYAVQRTRKELEERGLADERLDELDTELRLIDGDRGGVGPMREVPGGVAETQPTPDQQAGDEDWQQRTRALKWG